MDSFKRLEELREKERPLFTTQHRHSRQNLVPRFDFSPISCDICGLSQMLSQFYPWKPSDNYSDALYLQAALRNVYATALTTRISLERFLPRSCVPDELQRSKPGLCSRIRNPNEVHSDTPVRDMCQCQHFQTIRALRSL